MRIYLVGFMGSGKTTIGKRLARKLGFAFLDLDKEIEKTYKITIPFFFEKYDEKAFRKIEREILETTFDLQKTIISTGGGTPCFFNNMELINRFGTSVYIKMDPKSLYHRLLASKKKRPLIEQLSRDEVFSFIKKKLENRESFYKMADHIIKGENIDIAVLETLLNNSNSIME